MEVSKYELLNLKLSATFHKHHSLDKQVARSGYLSNTFTSNVSSIIFSLHV